MRKLRCNRGAIREGKVGRKINCRKEGGLRDKGRICRKEGRKGIGEEDNLIYIKCGLSNKLKACMSVFLRIIIKGHCLQCAFISN